MTVEEEKVAHLDRLAAILGCNATAMGLSMTLSAIRGQLQMSQLLEDAIEAVSAFDGAASDRHRFESQGGNFFWQVIRDSDGEKSLVIAEIE